MNRPHVRTRLALGTALVALTLALYAPVRDFSFLNYDDNLYVFENGRISRGLSVDNVVWSLTALENANWHPLTLISHMADVELFGLDPTGHHLVNLVLHAINVLLLFWLLAETTSRPWPSAWVAALFAVHPLNVQTVAWIAERKSLLSTAFWLAALLAHVGYRRRPGATRYAALLVLAALALAAKPMAVTLPLTLVLLDIWPLGVRRHGRAPAVARTVSELAPFVAMAGACGAMTLAAQSASGAIQQVATFSLPVRIGNAIVSYAWYLKSMVWPTGLAAFYPHPMDSLPVARVAVAALVLAAIGTFVIAKGRAAPAIAVGWWWYVGTLLPVAGLIQVGSQAYADRYAYVPLIGVFILVVWSVLLAIEGRPASWRRGVAVAGIVWVAALSLAARAQLPHWRDSVSLFQRAIDVVPDNGLAHNNLGMALVERNDLTAALDHFRKAVEFAPWDTGARSNLGNALRALGRPSEAIDAYQGALERSPEDASIHYNLATALIDVGNADGAVAHLREALRLNPSHAKARALLQRIERSDP